MKKATNVKKNRRVLFLLLPLLSLAGTDLYADNLTVLADSSVYLNDVFIVVPRLSAVHYGTESVVSNQKIGSYPVRSVNDILKYSASVDVRQRGPIGAQTDIGVRGSNFEQVGVLLDGINISDSQTGHNSFDLPLDKSDIDHISVIGNAFSMSSMMSAVNVVTRNHDRNRVAAHVEGGSFGYASAGAGVNLGGKRQDRNWNNMLSVNYGRSDGYSRNKAGGLNSDMEYKKAFYKGNFNSLPVSLGWHAGVSVKDWGSNTFYSSRFDDQFEHTLKTYTAIQAETHGKFNFQPRIWWNHTEDRFELIRGSESAVPFNYHRCDVAGAGFNSWVKWRFGTTSLGAELRNDNLVSGNLGETLDDPIRIKGTDRYYDHGLDRTNLSVSLSHFLYKSPAFSCRFGVVGTRNSWNGPDMRFYPALDIKGFIRPISVQASYTSSMRLPSVTELYYSVGGYKADKHLKPEELKSLSLEVDYNDFYGSGVDLRAIVYYNRYSNMIDWIMRLDVPESERLWESVNFTKVNSLGAELGVNLDLGKMFPGQRLLKSFDVTYNHIAQQKTDMPDVQSRTTLEYLKHKAVAGLSLNIVRNLDFAVNCRYQDREGTFTDTDGQVKPYEPYYIMDARAEYGLGSGNVKSSGTAGNRCKVYLECNNLTDRSYYDYGCVPQPGLWVVGGISVELTGSR